MVTLDEDYDIASTFSFTSFLAFFLLIYFNWLSCIEPQALKFRTSWIVQFGLLPWRQFLLYFTLVDNPLMYRAAPI